jgi:hypothetical protein
MMLRGGDPAQEKWSPLPNGRGKSPLRLLSRI